MAVGANGALPTEQRLTEEKSTRPNRGWPRSNWTIDGTRNTAWGASDSTKCSHSSTGKGVWYTQVIPSCIGAETKARPAKVVNGRAWSHRLPLHIGSELGTV